MVGPAVLLLADSRLPSGGHVHSGGVETAVRDGLLRDVGDLESFVLGRLRTAGPVLAAFAAGACAVADAAPDWTPWDRALSARTLSAGLRAASRAQGSALLRTVGRMWRTPAIEGLCALGRPHHVLVLGVAVAAGGGGAADAGLLAVHHLVGGACSAAVRLLGLDPLGVAAMQAALTPDMSSAAESGVEAALRAGHPDSLPATGAVLPELLAARHAAQGEATLFAS